MKRIFSLLLCLALLCGLLGGCRQPATAPAETSAAPGEVISGSTAPSTEPPETEATEATAEPGERSFGLAYVPEFGLNPYDCMCLTNRPILSLMYESLFVLNNHFEPEPVLCDRFAVSGDGLTYVLTLCDGVCFSDGSALTAQDVVASLYAATDSDYYGSRFSQVSAFGAQDARTVVITLNTPYENLPLLLDVPIVKHGTETDDVPTGSGPYRLSGQNLVKNHNWWQDAVAPLDANLVQLKLCATPSEVRDSFEFGGTTLVCVDINAPAAVGYRCDYELWDCPTTTMQYLGFNFASGICADPVFRPAITHVLDREDFIASIYKGFASAACLPCAPSSPLYDSKLASDYDYDPEAFATALRLSGVGRDYSGTILVCSADASRVELAHYIANVFADYHIKLTVNALDYDSYMYALSIGNFDMFIGETRLSGNFDLREFFRPYGALSFGGITSYDCERLCTSALENSGNYYDLHKKVMDTGYICPLLFKSYAVMVNRGAISNLQSSVDNVFHLPGGRSLADASVPYAELAYGIPDDPGAEGEGD